MHALGLQIESFEQPYRLSAYQKHLAVPAQLLPLELWEKGLLGFKYTDTEKSSVLHAWMGAVRSK